MLKYFTCENGRCEDKNYTDAALLLLRVVLGMIFIYHGYQKLFNGGAEDLTVFLESSNFIFPVFFGWLVSAIQFFGGIAVILGIFTRPFSALLAIIMIVAFWLAKRGIPEGDLVISLFAIATALTLTGSGKYALWKSNCCK